MNQYLQHPNFDPVLLHIWGPIAIRWYSLLYVGGFLVGRMILRHLARQERYKFTEEDVEQLIVWGLLGAVIGARVIYCFVYDPISLIQDPFYLFKVYQGGLSFHGGILGVMVAGYIFAKKRGIPWWNLADAMCLCATPGLGMGRIGNFINGELYGRVTDVPWGMVFRGGGPLPRHPSQLYELMLESVILGIVLWVLKDRIKTDGILSVIFAVGYTLARFIVEFFRQPDAHLGYLLLGLTMGQWLSIVMLVGTLVTGWYLLRQAKLAPVPTGKKRKKH